MLLVAFGKWGFLCRGLWMNGNLGGEGDERENRRGQQHRGFAMLIVSVLSLSLPSYKRSLS